MLSVMLMDYKCQWEMMTLYQKANNPQIANYKPKELFMTILREKCICKYEILFHGLELECFKHKL